MFIESTSRGMLEQRIIKERFNIDESISKVQDQFLKELLEFRLEGESKTYPVGENVRRKAKVQDIRVERFVCIKGVWEYIINLNIYRPGSENTERFKGTKCIKYRGMVYWDENFEGSSCNIQIIPRRNTKKAIKEALLQATVDDPFVLRSFEIAGFKHEVYVRNNSIYSFDYTRTLEKNGKLAHTCRHTGGITLD